ncbi:hypothetical protein Tco_1283565 [Tanacetum coccineum]
MDEFDKFAAKERELLESVYERLTALVNIMDHNNVRPIPVSINTKFLNCLQPEWSKYVTMVHHNQTGDIVSYDVLYDSLVQFKPHVLGSKAKKAAKNHDPLALLVHSNASSSQTYANSSYSPQPYYVTHPLLVVDYEDEYQGELNQAVIQDARVNTQTKNEGYGGNGHYARDCQKPRVRDAKYFREQMLLVMKDEAGSNLNNEENDFLLDNSYGEETMEDLTTAVMLMAKIQPPNGNAETVPSYDAKAVSEINVSSKETCEELARELRADKDTIERISKEKDKIQSDFFKIENEKIIIQHETQLAKKTFKERENRYLEDIVDLEEKLSSRDRIVYKMSQSIQTIHMLGKTLNKVYDPFLKAGLGYKNRERLKKAISAQPKMYDGEMLHSAKLNIDSPDSKESLEDAEESQLKMRNKMVQLNYGKLNALYETFVPQQEFSMELVWKFYIPKIYHNII